MNRHRYALPIPDNLLELADVQAHGEHTDRATALRQWLYTGAQAYVLRLYGEGRISVGRAADLLDTSPYEIYRLAHEQGLDTGDERSKRSRDTAAALLRNRTARG